MVRTASIIINGAMLLVLTVALFAEQASAMELAVLGCIMVFPVLSLIGLSRPDEGCGSWRGQWSEKAGRADGR